MSASTRIPALSLAIALLGSFLIADAATAADPVDTPAANATVTGTVTAPDGTPLPNINVNTSWNADSRVGTIRVEATTDAAGRFSLGVHAEPLVIRFYDFSDTWGQNAYPGGLTSTEKLAIEPGQTLDIAQRLQRAGVVTGRVRTASGKAVSNAMVQVGVQTDRAMFHYAATDVNGRYVVRGVAPGTYPVKFDRSGYADQWFDESKNARGADPVVVASGKTSKAVNAKLQRASSITGRVFVDGEPVNRQLEERVRVILRDSSGTVVRTARAIPIFTFKDIPNGRYSLQFCSVNADGDWLRCEYYDNVTSSKNKEVIAVKTGKKVTGLRANLISRPQNIAHPFSTHVTSEFDEDPIEQGEEFGVGVVIQSYVSRAGGTVTLELPGVAPVTKAVTADGRVNFRVSTAGAPAGDNLVRFTYSGTATTKPSTGQNMITLE
jgi:protocatechuate 3,4-dioxygenase beta subunit